MKLTIIPSVIKELQEKGVSQELLDRLREVEEKLVEFVDRFVQKGLIKEFQGSEPLVLGVVDHFCKSNRNEMPLPAGTIVKGLRIYSEFRKLLQEHRRLYKRLVKKTGVKQLGVEANVVEEVACESCEELFPVEEIRDGICVNCQEERKLEEESEDEAEKAIDEEDCAA